MVAKKEQVRSVDSFVNVAAELADISKEELKRQASMTPQEARAMFRSGEWTKVNSHMCLDYMVTNLAIVPKDIAAEFMVFANRNRQPIPVLEVLDPGNPHPKFFAPEADLRTDVSRYSVYRDGELVDEPSDIKKYWRDDLVSFIIGCSRNFERPFQNANIFYRQYYGGVTSIECTPTEHIHAHMEVTARCFKNSKDAVRAIQITSRNPNSHGAPIHIGDPSLIGIKTTSSRFPPLQPGEIPMFWACGTTKERAAIESKLPFMITQRPMHMFITDKRVEELGSL